MLVFLSRSLKQIPDFWYSHVIGVTVMNGRDRLSFIVITNSKLKKKHKMTEKQNNIKASLIRFPFCLLYTM